MTASFRTSLAAAACMAVFVTGIVPAAAQSPLKELRARQAEESRLHSEAAYTSSICDTRIGATIDWSRVRNWPTGESLADACDTALGAVETMCRDGRLEDIQSTITSFSCTGSGDGPALDGSMLRYGASPGVNGYRDTLKVLQDHLPE